MLATSKWVAVRNATIRADLAAIFAGDEERFDEAAVRVAEYLAYLLDSEGRVTDNA